MKDNTSFLSCKLLNGMIFAEREILIMYFVHARIVNYLLFIYAIFLFPESCFLTRLRILFYTAQRISD